MIQMHFTNGTYGDKSEYVNSENNYSKQTDEYKKEKVSMGTQ